VIILCDFEAEGTTVLQNIRNYSLIYTALCPRRLGFYVSQFWSNVLPMLKEETAGCPKISEYMYHTAWCHPK
jgi:hypothetical protein